jgi:hypothetical protein
VLHEAIVNMNAIGSNFATVLSALACVALLQHPASGATIRDDQPDSSYLSLAAQPDYAPVGKFQGSLTGSATLIAADWVLTTAHLIVSGASTFTINGNSYTPSQWVVHPGWTGNAFNGFDLVLVRLNAPVLGVTPASLYLGSSEVGAIGTFVGFGFTGTGLTGWQTLDNQKRAFQNVIDGDFGNPSVLLGSDFDNPHTPADNDFGDPTALLLEGCVAPGDSGGGVFLYEDSQPYLAGVISFVAGRDGSGNSDYGDVSGFGRVSTFAPWIASVVPEPSAATFLLATGFGLLLRRGWRK